MKKLSLLIFLIFSISFASNQKEHFKLPDVVFPLEIIAEKQEQKPPLKAPKILSLEKFNIPIYTNITATYPTDIKPIVGDIIKPKVILGFPREDAFLTDIIEQFTTGNFIFAVENGKKFLEKYSKPKYMEKRGVVYYILGLSHFEMSDLENSYENLKKACEIEFYLKTESCISASILAILTSNINDAVNFLNQIPQNEEAIFIKQVVSLLKKKNLEQINIKSCENLDIGLINYCRYVKGYILLSKENTEDALKLLNKVKGYEKYVDLLKGFAYLKENKVKKAGNIFNDFIDKYGKADILYKYALYGKLIVDIKKSKTKEVLENVGSLETRDKKLAQNIYIHLSYQLFKEKDYINAMAVAQRALNLYKNNKEILKKIIGVSAYNAGLYQYSYYVLKTIDSSLYNLYTGFASLNLQNIADAEFYFKKAYKKGKDKVKELALKHLADIYYYTNKDTKLIATLKILSNIDKKFSYNLLGWYFFKKKMYDKAYKSFIDTYMKAVSIFNYGNEDLALKLIKNSNSRKAKFLKAYIYLKKVNLGKARKLLKELSKGNDKIAQEAGYLYAYSYFSNGEYEKASKAFEEYYKKFKDTPLGKRAFLRMADSLYNIGKKEEAKILYTQFIKKYAGTKEAIDATYLLTVLEMKESSADVEKQIENFIEKYPEYKYIDLLKLQLANIYYEKGKKDKAFNLFRKLADESIIVSQQALYRLGYLLKKENRLEEAKKVLLEYLLKYPEGEFAIPSKQLLAEIYENLGKYELAVKLYKQLPETDQTTYKIAYLQFKMKKYFEAKRNFEKLYEKYPKYKNDIAYFLGKIELEKGNIQQAKRYFEDAVKGSDYNMVAESYLHLGDIYEKENKLDEALNSYVNIIYIYSQNDELVQKARIKSAKILQKQGKRIEASCMLEPLLEKDIKEAEELASQLPQCIKE